MCKKLIYICFILVMAVPVSAAEPILKVDINQDGTDTQPGFTGWSIQGWNLTQACFSNVIGDYMVELCGINESVGNMPGIRNRTDLCSWQNGDLYQDLFYVGSTGSVLMGRDYIQLSVTGLTEYTKYNVGIWSFDAAFSWGPDPNYSKYTAWSDVNPSDYLDSLGYGPDEGYNPTDYDDPCTTENESGIYKNPIPTLDRILAQGEPGSGLPLGALAHWSDFCVETDEYGNLVVYGWWDGDTWTGSQHVPINGFVIIPEPATIALLGLGGLALLRRRRR